MNCNFLLFEVVHVNWRLTFYTPDIANCQILSWFFFKYRPINLHCNGNLYLYIIASQNYTVHVLQIEGKPIISPTLIFLKVLRGLTKVWVSTLWYLHNNENAQWRISQNISSSLSGTCLYLCHFLFFLKKLLQHFLHLQFCWNKFIQFCLLEKVFIALSLLKTNSTGHRILGILVFSFSFNNEILHSTFLWLALFLIRSSLQFLSLFFYS